MTYCKQRTPCWSYAVCNLHPFKIQKNLTKTLLTKSGNYIARNTSKLHWIFVCIGFKPSVRNVSLYFVLSPETYTYLISEVKTARRLHQCVSRTYVKNCEVLVQGTESWPTCTPSNSGKQKSFQKIMVLWNVRHCSLVGRKVSVYRRISYHFIHGRIENCTMKREARSTPETWVLISETTRLRILEFWCSEPCEHLVLRTDSLIGPPYY